MSSTEVTNDEENTRFEIQVDGEPVGYADYRQAPRNLRAFMKTEVNEAYRGQGLGGKLIQAALDSTREVASSNVVYGSPVSTSFLRE